jgi:hypothetical protein
MRISCSSLNLYLYLSFLFITRYQHCSRAFDRKNRERLKSKNSVRCHLVRLPISLWRFCTKSSTHAIIAVVVMVTSATTARLLPLNLHHRRRLRPRHTAVCQSGPHPLPLTGGVPADDALGPRRPSKGSSRWVVCHPQLGLYQPSCTDQ